jgi:hypothetical protein
LFFNVLGLTRDKIVSRNLSSGMKEFILFRKSLTEALNEINKAEYVVFIRDVNLTNVGFPLSSLKLSLVVHQYYQIQQVILVIFDYWENGFLLNTNTKED